MKKIKKMYLYALGSILAFIFSQGNYLAKSAPLSDGRNQPNFVYGPSAINPDFLDKNKDVANIAMVKNVDVTNVVIVKLFIGIGLILILVTGAAVYLRKKRNVK